MMKKNMKKIIIALFAITILLTGNSAFAVSFWNGAANDCNPNLAIANFTTNTGYGNPCWASPSVSASPGDFINVRMYYHNTSDMNGGPGSTATNVHLSLNMSSGSSSSHTITGVLTSQGNYTFSPATVNISSAQIMTWATTYWYPNQTSNFPGTPLLNGQSGSEVMTSTGLNIGSIAPGWSSQGSVVIGFQIGTTPPPQGCAINSFTGNPLSINSGGSSTLNWSTSNCTTVSVTGPNFNSSYLSGPATVYPPSASGTYSYNITASNQSGSAPYQPPVTITVNQLQTCNISITANPSSINSGGSSMLTWSSSSGCNNVSVAGPNFTYNGNPNSSQTVYPPTAVASYLYTISATGAQSQTASITVNNLLTTGTLTASMPTCIISSGASNCQIPFSWNTVNPPQGAISSVTYNGNTMATGNSGNNQPFSISNGSETFYLYNSANLLAQQTVSGSCASGTSWNGSSCTPQVVNICSISNFSSSSTSITSGQSVTLSWTTSNCNSGTIYPTVGSINNNIQSGSQPVSNITGSTTFTMTAYGANNSQDTKTVTVNVNQQQNNCTIYNFTASPTYLNYSGGSSTLSWSLSSGCISASISPSVGNITGQTSTPVYPTYTTTYILTAYDSTGVQQTRQATVTVDNNQNSNCYISYFTVNNQNSVTLQSGSPATIAWNVTNSNYNSNNNCTVSVSGPNFSGSGLTGSQTIYPTYSGTYVLSVYGSGSGTQTQSVYVTVNNTQYNNCSISYFNASPSSINYGGSSALSWGVNGNCNNVSITNLGSVNNTGSQNVYPTYTTTYTMTASGSGNYGGYGGQDTRSVTVSVNNYTPPPTPVYNTCAVTTVATNVTQNGATLNGLVSNSTGANATAYFEYGPTVNMGQQTNPQTANSNATFSQNVSGLSQNTIYFYRFDANCGTGTSQGSINIFQTSGITTNTHTTTTIIRQGTTIIGTESPIMLKIEDQYQTIKVGDDVNYTVTYQNISKRTLTHPMLQVILPKGITFVKSSQGTYSSDSYTLTVPLSDLVPNVQGIVYLQGHVDSIDTGNAQIVTTALLVYTAKNGAQENAMAYVLNTPDTSNGNGLTAAAIFGSLFGIGILGWMLLLVLILLAILLYRKISNKPVNN